ncbi:MAG: twin-arginine translocase subunit TatC [Alphaproteobacteria bacterium]|nr:twin-arginine translocase subunit TatC [Alphaproteobacteria bacterium]
MADSTPDDMANSRAPVIEHLKELRTRLIYSFAALMVAFLVSFYFADVIFNFLTAPLMDLWQDQSQRRMIFTAMHEKFFTDVKIAFFAAFCIAFPVLASQIWVFITPGLYRNEKKAFFPFLLMTPILFFLGASFVYYLVLPVAWEFFISFEQQAGAENLAIVLEPKVNEYLSLTMRLILAFGVCFELPVLLVLLVRAGLTDAQGLIHKRRYAILLAFVAAAILTPPDPMSQIGLAVPIILLYEVSILCAKLIERKAARADTT